MKKTVCALIALVMLVSLFAVIPVGTSAAGTWTEVSTYSNLKSMLSKPGTAYIKLSKDIEKQVDPGKASEGTGITVAGEKYIDLNGHELLYDDSSNVRRTNDSKNGMVTVASNYKSTFIDVPAGASLTVSDSGSGGKIRTSGYYVGTTYLDDVRSWDFYTMFAYRDAISVSGVLTVKGGTIEAGGSKSQFFSEQNTYLEGGTKSIARNAYQIILGTAVEVRSGGKFYSFDGRYDGHESPVIKALNGSTVEFYGGTVCAQCSADCFSVEDGAKIKVYSGSFNTYYKEYVRRPDHLSGAIADEGRAQTLVDRGGRVTLGNQVIFHRLRHADYGHIGIPKSAISNTATVKQNGKTVYDPDWKGDTTVTPFEWYYGTRVTDMNDSYSAVYVSGTSMKVKTEVPLIHYDGAQGMSEFHLFYFWDLSEQGSDGKMKAVELKTNDKKTYLTYTNTLDLKDLDSLVAGGLKEGGAYSLSCTVQEALEDCEYQTIRHNNLDAKLNFTVSKKMPVDKVEISSSYAAGTTVSNSAPISVKTASGIAGSYVELTRDGKKVNSGEKLTFGTYSGEVVIEAESGYVFTYATKIIYNGKTYAPSSVQSDGRSCLFELPAYYLNCQHKYGAYSSDDKTHWQVCTVCGESTQKTDHTWKVTESGKTATARCTVCGKENTYALPETRTPVQTFLVSLPDAYVGDTPSSKIELGYMTDNSQKWFDYASIASVEYSPSAKLTAQKTTVTVTLKANEGFYFKSTSFATSTNSQYTKLNQTYVNDTTFKVAFQFTPLTRGTMNVVIPKLEIGKLYLDLTNGLSISMGDKKFTNYSLSIKTGGETVISNVNAGVASESYMSREFKPGTKYEMNVSVQLGPYDVTGVSVDPGNTYVSNFSKGTVVFDFDFEFETGSNVLDTVGVTGLQEPEFGKDITASGVAAVSDMYSVIYTNWRQSGKFTCGVEYTFSVAVQAKHGYTFTSADKLKECSVNGREANKVYVSEDGLTVTLTRVFEPIQHSLSKKTTLATCTEAGTVTATCTLCGEKIEDTVTPATGHNYVHYDAVPADCMGSGCAEHYQCTFCQAFFDADKKDSTWESIRLPKDPNNHFDLAPMVTETFHFEHCSCGFTQNLEEHKFGSWTVICEPTSEDEGLKEMVCSVCGYVRTATVAKLPADTTAEITAQETAAEGGNDETGTAAQEITTVAQAGENSGKTEKKTGCGSALSAGVLALSCIAAAYVLSKKRR